MPQFRERPEGSLRTQPWQRDEWAWPNRDLGGISKKWSLGEEEEGKQVLGGQCSIVMPDNPERQCQLKTTDNAMVRGSSWKGKQELRDYLSLEKN